MARNKYRWPDGKLHSRPYAGHGGPTVKQWRRQQAKPKPRKGTVPPLRPPAGSYDPALDASERAAGRGLSDLLQDIETQGQRGTSDWMLGLQNIAREKGELREDVATERAGVERGYGRNLADLLTQRRQGTEDYQRSIAELQRGYGQLANAQAQAQRAAGVAAGGAVAQAAQKRAANMAFERQPIDVSNQRFQQASALAQNRLGEDRRLSLDALLRQEQRGLGQLSRAGGELNLGYQRGQEDLNVQGTRGQREYQAYLQDLAATRQAQARTSLPALKPKRKRGAQKGRGRRGTARQVGAGLGGM